MLPKTTSAVDGGRMHTQDTQCHITTAITVILLEGTAARSGVVACQKNVSLGNFKGLEVETNKHCDCHSGL